MYTCVGGWGEEAFFFSNKDIPANRYRDLGASPSELRESWMKVLLLHHMEGSGCSYNYYGTLIIGKERLCGQLPGVRTITMVHI